MTCILLFLCSLHSAFMQAKDLCHYRENKSKYYVQKKLRGFQEGLEEIEKNPLIKYGAKKKQKSDDEDDDEDEDKTVSDKKVG